MENGVSPPKKMPVWMRVFILVLTPAAFFYLFVVPMAAATAPVEYGVGGILFGAFMLLQLFMLVGIYAFEAAADFYRFQRPKKLLRLLQFGENTKVEGNPVTSMFLSYLFLNYAFAVLYVFISNIDEVAFSGGRMGPFEGWYFSTLIGATVAFGDVAPKSMPAKGVVMAHITISLLYVVLLFSASSSFLTEKRRRSSSHTAG